MNLIEKYIRNRYLSWIRYTPKISAIQNSDSPAIVKLARWIFPSTGRSLSRNNEKHRKTQGGLSYCFERVEVKLETFRGIFAACVFALHSLRLVDVSADLFAVSPKVIVRAWLRINPGSAHSRWNCTNDSKSTVKLLRQKQPRHGSHINNAFSSCVSDLQKISFVLLPIWCSMSKETLKML